MSLPARLQRPALLGAAAILLALVPGVAGAASSGQKVILVSWDAGADWVVDRCLAEGRLPNVARLAHRGVQADYMTAAFPSKTAVGHAAIFTGCWGDRNGIASNLTSLTPRGEHTLLEYRSGFSSEALTAEPIFVTAAKAGKKVVALSGTHLWPAGPLLARLDQAGAPRDRLLAFDGFDSTIAEPEVLLPDRLKRPAGKWRKPPRHVGTPRELQLAVGSTDFFALVFDDPADPVKGLDTVLIRRGSRDADEASSCILKPAPARDQLDRWSPPFDVTLFGAFGLAYFRLFELAPDGSRLRLYQRSVHGLTSTTTPEEALAYLRASGGFTDESFSVYLDGQLGPPVWQGGDGEAESRMLELVRLDFELAKRGTRWAIERWNPDFLLHYTPLTDGAGHAWVGALDPSSPIHDPDLAARIWPFYAKVFELADGWLGDILDVAGQDHVVALVSDHGMAGAAKYFYPNAVLAQAGLLPAVRREGALSQTRIFAPPGGDFYVSVNGTDWKGGTVAPAQREEVLRAATRALLSARDPETGDVIVTAVLRASDLPGLGIGGPRGGDLYLDLAPGYYPSPRLSNQITERFHSPVGHGEHGFHPQRRLMHAIYYMAGPGVAQGKAIPAVRQVDVFPTLARLLGIEPPADVVGHVIGEALAGEQR